MAVEIGAALPKIQVRVSPGRDHTWHVAVTDASGNPLPGTLRMTLKSLTLTTALVSGAGTFILPASQATESLIGGVAVLDLLYNDKITAVANGKVARA